MVQSSLSESEDFRMERIDCQCGEAWQSKSGWEAQGLMEDVKVGRIWKMKRHLLPPEKCVVVDS
jgi:hypothetical protein